MAEDLDCFLCKCALHYVQYLDLLNGDTARPTGKSFNMGLYNVQSSWLSITGVQFKLNVFNGNSVVYEI